MSVLVPCGGLAIEVARDLRRPEQRVDAGLRSEAQFEREPQVWRKLEVNPTCDKGAKLFLVTIERLDRHVALLAAERHHRHRRDLKVRRHAHPSDGHGTVVERLIGELSACENLRHRMADEFAHSLHPVSWTVRVEGSSGHCGSWRGRKGGGDSGEAAPSITSG